MTGAAARVWAVRALVPATTVLISLIVWLSGTPVDGRQVLYLCPVLFAGYALRPTDAWLNLALVAAVYPPLTLYRVGTDGLAAIGYLLGTLLLTLWIVVALHRRADRWHTALTEEARTDGLTGLANRRAWNEALAMEVRRHGRHGQPLSLLVMDIDRFKFINERAGHAAGDLLLRRVAEVMRRHTRATDVLARIGGEEFALLMPSCLATEAAGRAQQIRSAVENASLDWPQSVTMSIGVANLPQHAATAEDLMVAADRGLYRAKRGGRNSYRIASPPSTPASTPATVPPGTPPSASPAATPKRRRHPTGNGSSAVRSSPGAERSSPGCG